MVTIPLKGKIFLALLIPLALALIILSTTGTNLINMGVSELARDQEASMAIQISQRMSDALDRYPGYLLSALGGSEPGNITAVQVGIDAMNQSGMDLIFDQGVAYYSLSGEILAHTAGDAGWQIPPGQMQSLVAARRPVYSPLNMNSSIPYISLFVPVIQGNNGVTAIAEGRISPEYSLFGSRLIEILEIRENAAGYALLLDTNGNILYQRFQGDLYEEIGADLASQFRNESFRGTSTAVIMNNLTGREQYAGYNPVEGTPFGIIAHEDRGVILKGMDQYLALIYLLFIGTFVFSILLILLLINYILSPFHSLLEGVKAVRKGELQPFPFPRYHDEFEVLTNEFNRMISALNASFADLETAKLRYQSILNQAYDGFLIIHAKTLTIEESNRMAGIITGNSPEEMAGMSLLSLIAEKDRERFRDHILSLTNKGMRGEFEGFLIRKNNEERIVEITTTLIILDGTEYFQTNYS